MPSSEELFNDPHIISLAFILVTHRHPNDHANATFMDSSCIQGNFESLKIEENPYTSNLKAGILKKS